jgi:hypothetical protein
MEREREEGGGITRKTHRGTAHHLLQSPMSAHIKKYTAYMNNTQKKRTTQKTMNNTEKQKCTAYMNNTTHPQK